MITQRLLKFVGIAIGALLLAAIIARIYVEWAAYHRQISAEARVLDSQGRAAFAALPNPRGSTRVSIGAAVNRAGGLWPCHVVYSGEFIYAFDPLDRVFVLASDLDGYRVDSFSKWKGATHDFTYPETPSKGDWAARMAFPPSNQGGVEPVSETVK